MVMAASDGGGTQRLEPIASADTVVVTSSKRPADNGKGGMGSSGFLFCRSMRQAAFCQFVAEHFHQVGMLCQRLDCCHCCKGIGSKPPSPSRLACL